MGASSNVGKILRMGLDACIHVCSCAEHGVPKSIEEAGSMLAHRSSHALQGDCFCNSLPSTRH